MVQCESIPEVADRLHWIRQRDIGDGMDTASFCSKDHDATADQKISLCNMRAPSQINIQPDSKISPCLVILQRMP